MKTEMRKSLFHSAYISLMGPFMALLLLTSCGGNGKVGEATKGLQEGAQPVQSAVTTLSGTAVKGPVAGAVIEVKILNPDGSVGAVVGRGIANEQGEFNIELADFGGGAVVVEVIGGQYVDEATGDLVIVPTEMVALSLAAQVAGGQSMADLSVTPLTTMAAERAKEKTKKGIALADAIPASQTEIGNHFGVANIDKTRPADLTDDTPDDRNAPETVHGLVLSALSQSAKDISDLRGMNITALALTEALSRDGKDEIFDGKENVTVDIEISNTGIILAPDQTSAKLSEATDTFLANIERNKSNLNSTDAEVVALKDKLIQQPEVLPEAPVEDESTATPEVPTVRVSVGQDPSGNPVQSDGTSIHPVISENGLFVAFQSMATNLAAGATSGMRNVFRYDVANGKTIWISEPDPYSAGQLEGGSEGPSISADGTLIAFDSTSTKLVEMDTNGSRDVFVRDLRNPLSPRTTSVSVSSGRKQGDKQSMGAAISAKGDFTAFKSLAGNFIPDPPNGFWQAFIHEELIDGERTEIMSVNAYADQMNGSAGNIDISSDGSSVVWETTATNLVDTEGNYDIYLRNNNTKLLTWVSVGFNGAQPNGDSRYPAVSKNGRFVVFSSTATNLVQTATTALREHVYLRDTCVNTQDCTPKTILISADAKGVEADNSSTRPAITPDGRFIVFSSTASNLDGSTNWTSNIFVYDTCYNAGTSCVRKTMRVSKGLADALPDRLSEHPDISADGRYVVFQSYASNIVEGDTNGTWDIFLVGPLYLY